MKLREIWDEFLRYKIAEDGIKHDTVVKYNDCLNRFIGLEGNLEVEMINLDHFTDLKYRLQQEKISPARIRSIIFCMRSLFRFLQKRKKLKVLNAADIEPPKKEKKDIVFLDNIEVQKLRECIDLNNIHGLRFRTLIEVLLDTGARINEAIQLDRTSFVRTPQTVYAEIIGKGNKKRKLLFSNTSLYWINRYLKARHDDYPAIFITHCVANRLKHDSVWRDFKKYNKKSGINKKITSHICRHTFATNLLINGCGIAYIQKMLGHEDINTTIRHYAHLDDRAIIEAKCKFLDYSIKTPIENSSALLVDNLDLLKVRVCDII